MARQMNGFMDRWLDVIYQIDGWLVLQMDDQMNVRLDDGMDDLMDEWIA